MANRYVKICPASFIVREMRIKMTVRYHLTPVRMAVITKTRITSVAEDVERKEPSCTAGGNTNWCSHCGDSMEVPQEIKSRINHMIQLFHYEVFIQRK